MFKSILSVDEMFEPYDLVYIDTLLLESVKSLVKTKDFYKAYGLSKLIRGSDDSAESLISIAEGLVDSNNKQDAILLFNKASDVSFQYIEIWKQADMLCRIAYNFHKLGLQSEAKKNFEKAINAAKKGESSQDLHLSVYSSSALGGIALTIAKTGEVNWALEIAESIKSSGKRENTYCAINSIKNY